MKRQSRSNGERGQVLVLFAGGVLALLAFAALAFDTGMLLLEKRDAQNAADAAALAGARYVFDGDCVAPAWTCSEARAHAAAVALENGYDSSDPNTSVVITIPAQHGRYDGLPNFIEVDLSRQRASIFAGVLGIRGWPVSVFAVATNDQDVTFPFSMLALNETVCKAIKISGQGEVIANGNVQSNSDGSEDGCGGIGLSRSGGGELTVTAEDATCRSAGSIQDQGSGTLTCTQAPDSFALPDPLRFLDDPVKPAMAAPMQPVGHSLPISDWCPGSPGSHPPTETSAQGTCDPGDKASGIKGITKPQYTGKAWILSPGLYPNGIHATNNTILYLLPGVYWIEGGGFQVDGGSTVISIKDVADANVDPALATFSGNDCEMDPSTPATTACGVLIFNSESTTIPIASGPISLGGAGGRLLLSWFDVPETDPYYEFSTMSIYQDRDVEQPVTFNGSSADSEVGGVVYVPGGSVTINGSDSDFVLDQIIADQITVNGNVGTIDILKRVGFDAIIQAAGLVD